MARSPAAANGGWPTPRHPAEPDPRNARARLRASARRNSRRAIRSRAAYPEQQARRGYDPQGAYHYPQSGQPAPSRSPRQGLSSLEPARSSRARIRALSDTQQPYAQPQQPRGYGQPAAPYGAPARQRRAHARSARRGRRLRAVADGCCRSRIRAATISAATCPRVRRIPAAACPCTRSRHTTTRCSSSPSGAPAAPRIRRGRRAARRLRRRPDGIRARRMAARSSRPMRRRRPATTKSRSRAAAAGCCASPVRSSSRSVSATGWRRATRWWRTARPTGRPPVVRGDTAPSKTTPADPGGKQFAHTDSKIMGRLGEGCARQRAAAASPDSDVDTNGARKVQTLVVGRDGSIAPPPATPDERRSRQARSPCRV